MELAIVVIWGICGLTAAGIASGRDRSAFGWFLVGIVFGPLGVLAALIVGNGDPVPLGTRRVVCTRCSARQNVDVHADHFQCWQCDQRNDVTPFRKSVARQSPPNDGGGTWQEWLGKEPPAK